MLVFTAGMNYNNIDWDAYRKMVEELENEGFTTSDAQGTVDAWMIQDPTLFRK